MRSILCILFSFLATMGSSQQVSSVKIVPQSLKDPKTLALKITSTCTTELEKVRSIFYWITENISYKVKPTYWSAAQIKALYDDDTSLTLKPINERVAENVLRSNSAVCDGYARLFATLCYFANIRAEVITGYARFNSPATSTFKSNHSWNAVRIDSAWHLLDVTWASGYIAAGEFVRRYNSYYFLTPPQQFIHDHYPENLEWTLLSSPPTLKEFDHTPFKSQRFIKAGVVSFKPKRGVIEAAVGDTIVMEMEINRLRQNTDGSFDTSVDILEQAPSSAWAFIQPDGLVTTKNIRYTYIVSTPSVSWLNLVLYDDVVMRYQLKVRANDVVLVYR